MKVAYITEMNYGGQQIPRDYLGMRTEQAWPCTLKADCYTFGDVPEKKYDLGLIIIPKPEEKLVNAIDKNFLDTARQFCDKIGVMQEGPAWFFQRYSLQGQINYFNSLRKSDIIFCHNRIDKRYFEGITGHSDVRILPTLMIEDSVKNLPQVERKGVMVGGNFVEWYGGFDSFMVANSIGEEVYSPKMGQRQEGEEQLGLKQLPYMVWTEWIKTLNNFKYGVHLMKTHAAGTFALNCAYLGIPCIGYEGLDTQEICHPNLSVKIGDVLAAREKIHKLKEDKAFYNFCSEVAKDNYKKHYHENKFNTTWKEQFKIS
jgi:hypothetical protein